MIKYSKEVIWQFLKERHLAKANLLKEKEGLDAEQEDN